jgi:hypothetical protein
VSQVRYSKDPLSCVSYTNKPPTPSALINSSPRSPTKAIIDGSHPESRPSLSKEHLEFRRLVAEIEKYNEPSSCEPDDEKAIEAREATLGRLSDKISAIQNEISMPARTLADVLLRAETALYNENGVMNSLDDDDANENDQATAQLIRAATSALGGLYTR